MLEQQYKSLPASPQMVSEIYQYILMTDGDWSILQEILAETLIEDQRNSYDGIVSQCLLTRL